MTLQHRHDLPRCRQCKELRAQLQLAKQQRDELALELEKLRDHAYEKYSNKRNRL